jgi:hypothetical protein
MPAADDAPADESDESAERRTARRRWGIAFAIATAHTLLAIAFFRTVRFDDAFIVYRYGQNLAEGRGLVFNANERVWGSTTVLWVFVSALVHRMFGHEATPSVMAAIGCLAWTAQAVIIYALCCKANQPLIGILAASAIALGSAGSFCWVGLETNLAFALGLGTIHAALAQRWRIAATLAALAILSRPDMAIPALLSLLLAWQRLGLRRAARHAALSVALLAPWYVYQAVHFGSSLSSSMTAKLGHSTVGHYALHIVSIVPAELLGMVTGWSAPLVALYATPLVWPLVVYGAVAIIRLDRRLFVLPAWLVMHFAGYLAWRPLTNQSWHMYPAVAISCLLCCAAIVAIARRIREAKLIRSVALPLVALTLALLSILRMVSFATVGQQSIFWFGGRDAAYRKAAAIIREQSSPDDVVAAGEVGTLAYYSDAIVLDWNGLVTEHARDLVGALARGDRKNVRWIVAWAIEDVIYFRATLDGHTPRIYKIPASEVPGGSERSIYFFDLVRE